MAVTDPTAIQFCNQMVRPCADQMARAYYLCVAAVARWNGLGGGSAALAVMSADICRCADAIKAAYLSAYSAEVYWFLGVNGSFPNDTTTVSDGSPGDGRPAATGTKVNAVLTNVVQFQNWLLSATESFTDAARNNRGALNTVYQASSGGTASLQVSDAGNLINRAGELIANYTANTNANLSALLAMAVNPGSP